jgi:hypothetical protein
MSQEEEGPFEIELIVTRTIEP